MQDILRRYSNLQTAWTTATGEISGLVARSKPWKELTDRFDELCSRVEDVEGLVETDEGSVEELEEADGGGLSDFILNFKVRGREGGSNFKVSGGEGGSRTKPSVH